MSHLAFDKFLKIAPWVCLVIAFALGTWLGFNSPDHL